MKLTLKNALRISVLAGCLTGAVVGCGGGDDDTSGGGGALVAPNELKAVILAGPAVHLTWKDTPGEHHYSIERKEGDGTFTEISTTVLNVTQYHDANVTAGKTYTYRVAGSKETLEKGAFSAEVSATVP